MSTHIPVMQVAFELVQQAVDAGIAIESSYAYGDKNRSSVTLLCERDADAPALASLLGLTVRSTQPYGDAETIESFRGQVGMVEVNTQWSYPLLAVTA